MASAPKIGLFVFCDSNAIAASLSSFQFGLVQNSFIVTFCTKPSISYFHNSKYFSIIRLFVIDLKHNYLFFIVKRFVLLSNRGRYFWAA